MKKADDKQFFSYDKKEAPEQKGLPAVRENPTLDPVGANKKPGASGGLAPLAPLGGKKNVSFMDDFDFEAEFAKLN